MLYRQGSLPLLFTQKLNLDILLLGHESSLLQEEAADLASHLSFCLVPSPPHPPAFLPLLSLLSGGEGRKNIGRKSWVLHFPHTSPCSFPGCPICPHLSVHNPWHKGADLHLNPPPRSTVGGFTWLCKSKFGNISCISSRGNCNYQLSSKEKVIVVFLCPQKDSFMSPQSLMIKMKS